MIKRGGRHHGHMQRIGRTIAIPSVLLLIAGCSHRPAVQSAPPDNLVLLTATNLQFQPTVVRVTHPGGELKVSVENRDTVAHNIHVFLKNDPSAGFQSPDVVGKSKKVFDASLVPCFPCQFEFRCEIHPATMHGIIEARKSSA